MLLDEGHRRAIAEALPHGPVDEMAAVEGIDVLFVGPGDLVFIPAEEKHRLRSKEPLFYFEFQAPNRFKTTILDGTKEDLLWERRDGKVWVQS